MGGMVILFKLFCAHLCADFILQPNKLNEGKREKGITGLFYLLLHGLIHAVCAYVFVALWSKWLIPVVVFVSHCIIDYVKYQFKESAGVFVIDQVCHVAVMVALWLWMFADNDSMQMLGAKLSETNIWLIVAAYFLMCKPSSILMNLFLKKWTLENTVAESLPKAGQLIGYIERILILTFILFDGMECVGFLLAAKSVFRFGELNKASEIKTTEYVLVGTLLSFALAILTGFALKSVLLSL